MMMCCYVAGLICAVGLLGWALIRDRRCGVWLLLQVAVSGGLLAWWGLPCHGGPDASRHVYCGEPLAQRELSPNEVIAVDSTAVDSTALNPLRWAAVWATGVSGLFAIVRGVFLIMTVRRDETLGIVRGVIRFVWKKILRRKSPPPCCGEESPALDNPALTGAAGAPSQPVTAADFA